MDKDVSKERMRVKMGRARWNTEFREGEVKWSMSVAVFNAWDYCPFVCSELTQSLSPCKTHSHCRRHPDQADKGREVHCCNQLANSKRRINWGNGESGDKEGRHEQDELGKKNKYTWSKQVCVCVCVCGKNGVEEDVRRAVMKHWNRWEVQRGTIKEWRCTIKWWNALKERDGKQK